MWKPDAWDELKDALPDGNDGSRVLLTTRNKVVALHADVRSEPLELRFLTEAESWELFCKKSFPGRNANFNEDMEKQGREIVRKCGGLPLAIVVIGGLLSRKEPSEWENVRKSISWQFVEGEVQISGILSLSYKDLPYDLKPCFLYLGNFPEDYEFSAKKLVELWAAEGFLHQRGEEMVEEVGVDCLKELIGRSLVQVARRSATGAIKNCRIHDLLRDLCISEGKKERFLEFDRGEVSTAAAAISPSGARRLAIHYRRRYNSFLRSTPTQNLRSILIHSQEEVWLDRGEKKLLCGSFKLNRVLDLIDVLMENVPNQVGDLIHLRYLACNLKSHRLRLPSSIANLTSFQTLFLKLAVWQMRIPITIGKIKELRHLRVEGLGV